MNIRFTGDVFIGEYNNFVLPYVDKAIIANQYLVVNLEAPITTRNHPISKKKVLSWHSQRM